MDREIVADLLGAHLGAPVQVSSLRQTFPGQSQETWLVEAVIGAGEHRGFVLRINPPGGGIVPIPLRQEWEVYRLLWATDIPVGEPLWYAEGGEEFEGRPYFVRDLVAGSTEIEGLHEPGPAGDALRREAAFEHARVLAALHTLDWEAAGFGELLEVPAGPGDAARREFDQWCAVWDAVRPEPFPVVTRAMSWFEANLPTTAPRVSLLKGNNGLGEEIWDGTRIVALSDWELASLGDPAQDWAFSQGMLHLWDRDEILDHYEQAAGFTLARENLDFWTVWTVFKAMCCTTAGLRGFLDGRDLRPVLPAIGFGVAHLMEQVLALVTTMDLGSAAQMITAMGASQLQDPAAGGAGRRA
jgi:aminoglycoside phosphotransferase (APT) family kinase protein